MRLVRWMLWASAASLAPASLATAQGFVDVTAPSGAANLHLGMGLAWGDYDGDGDLDLYVANAGAGLGAAPNTLFRNNGDGTFTDVAATNQVGTDMRLDGADSIGAAWGDYDNDGDLDLYIVNYLPPIGGDVLYRNNGDGTFSLPRGNIFLNAANTAVAWGDYDRDGYLDAYVCRYFAANALWHNNRDGTFTDVAAQAGVADRRDSEGAAWGDFDGDGDPDLYVVNREQEDALYRNNGDGTFVEIGCGTGTNNTDVGKNATWGDYDNDGDLDLYVANIGANALYRNGGDGTFVDVAAAANVRDRLPGWIGTDAAWGDYDHDGMLDLFVVNGFESRQGEASFLFRNQGDGTFESASASVGITGSRSSTACGWGDYDDDGDLDLYLVSNDFRDAERSKGILYRNEQNDARYVKVRLKGADHVDAIGAKVRLSAAGTTTLVGYREIASRPDALEALFGADPAGTYDVEATFPSGTVRRVEGVSAGRTVEVPER